MLTDLRYSLRGFRRSPGVTAIAILTLALGIGTSTAMFGAVDSVLLRTLPVANPERLVLMGWSSSTAEVAGSVDDRGVVDPATGVRTSRSFSTLGYERFRDASAGLASVFAFARIEQLNVFAGGEAEIASGLVVSGDYHAGLGVAPERGRLITRTDDDPASEPVVVISHRYWERRFGLDPSVIGRMVELNGVAFTVVGVTPAAFSGTLDLGESADLTVPLAFEPALRPGDSNLREPWNWWLYVMGRLQPGARADESRAKLEVVFQRAALEGWDAMPAAMRAQPEFQGPRALPRLEVSTGSRGLAGGREDYVRRLRLLAAVALGLLLIACANVAGLLLIRAESRHREIAVRRALGASRARVVRQLVTEGVVLSVAGAVAGVIITLWLSDALLSVLPLGSASALDIHVNARMLGFAVGLSVITGTVIGALPALATTNRAPNESMRGIGRSTPGGRGALRTSMTVAQVSLAFVLLTMAGLFVSTLQNLQRVELGFDIRSLLLFRVDPRLSGYKGAEIGTLYETLVERLEAVPGVRSVTLSRHPLLAGSSERTGDGLFVRGPGGQIQQGDAYLHRVRWNFFETMRVPVRAGRGLTAADDQRAPKVAVVNESFARHYFGAKSALGERFSFGSPTEESFEIVGVVKDAKYTGQRDAVPSTVYLAYQQAGPSQMNFAVRTSGDPLASVSGVRAAIREVDQRLPVFEMRTQAALADERLAAERRLAWLSSASGLIALLLTCLALHATLSVLVSRRTREFGIRMALGAQQSLLVRSVVGEALTLVGVGLLVGVLTAHGLTGLVREQIFGLQAGAPHVLVSAGLAMLAVGALAAYMPARQATRVDPVVALRAE